MINNYSTRRLLLHFDFTMIVLLLPIVITSMYLVYESAHILMLKQLIYVFVGIIVFSIAFFIPYRRLDGLIDLVYYLSLILLVLTLFIGDSKLGARRWLDIPFTSFSIQPSEFVKITAMLMFAKMIRDNPPPRGGYMLKDFIKLSLVILVPFVLILKQPDLGTALVLAIMGFGALFLIGVDKKIWIVLAILGMIFIPVWYKYIAKPYQVKRLHDFVATKPSYHVQQSIIAVGNGGLFGKPKEESTQSSLKFLPIVTSDFIFAYFVERFGFIGAVVLIALYATLIFHILSFSLLNERDYFLKVCALCLGMLLFIYTSINIAMTIGLAPVVGIPLPMFSYGGSSFVTFAVLFGILENLLAFRFNFEYNGGSRFSGLLAQLVRALGS